MSADIAEFVRFFRGLYGVEPFPWQEALARRLVRGEPPPGIAAPTASGKTAALDAMAWAASVRGGPRRIVYVVDRRIVCDAAYDRASGMADALTRALADPVRSDPTVATVARRLADLADDREPLRAALLRGGMVRDETWADNPARPTILVGTVDMVGSRLLGRGYGLGRAARLVHMGLLGTDAAILLDEGHLSTAFATTVRSARMRAGDGPTLIVMSATAEGDGVLRTGERDARHPLLGRRLRARKRAELAEVGDISGLPTALAEQARRLARDSGPGAVVGVVVNRVSTARAVREVLAADMQPGDAAVLLTGRVRPLDRDDILGRWWDQIRVGRERPGVGTRTVYLVATQTIEVGADIDLDALVTEAAPIDCLIQRAGRLDRLGSRGESVLVIVAVKGAVGPRGDDVIYGPAVAKTWAWLRETARQPGGLDFGPLAIAERLESAEDRAAMLAAQPEAPPLSRAAAEALLLAAESEPEPDVAALLHGRGHGSADISLVWRADVDGLDPVAWAEVVAELPPSTLEALPVPLGSARAWLAGVVGGSDAADIEGVPASDGDGGGAGRRALIWRGPDESRVGTMADLRPGDVVVVPASYGGCDEWGWHPASSASVADLGDRAHWLSRGRAVLRPATLGIAAELASLRTAALMAAGEEPPAWLAEILARATAARVGPVGPYLAEPRREAGPGLADGLMPHSRAVAAEATRIATALKLGGEVVEAIRRAALLHDVGKADERFRAMLAFGVPPGSPTGPGHYLAKSGHDPATVAAARRLCGLPVGWRHEGLSAALALAVGAGELAAVLVGLHHGHGRPRWPAVGEGRPVDALLDLESVAAMLRNLGFDAEPATLGAALRRVGRPEWPGSGWADLLDAAVRRLGPYRMALAAAVLIAADHRVSREAGEGSDV